MKIKNINLNLRKMVKLRGISLALVATTLAVALTGCGKKADCNVAGKHAHLYTDKNGYVRYIDKEYLEYEGFSRSDEYVAYADEEKDFYKFLDKRNLTKIEDNLDVIKAQQEQNQDYLEYRYSYIFLHPIPHHVRTGKTSYTYFTYIPLTHHSWTRDANHSRLTGEQRLCHYVYTAYKIEKDEHGKYVLIPSDSVDDITTVMDEYPYIICGKYSKVVDIYGVDVDYEDGPSELSPEEQEKQNKEYEGQVQDQEQTNTTEKSLKKTK